MQRAPLHLLPLMLFTLAACSWSSTDAPPEPGVTEQREQTREPETPPAEPEGSTPPTTPPPVPQGAPDGARIIRPLSAGILNCIEMYSVCTPDPAGGPPSCTSAHYHLACGRSGHVPGSTETLYCACP